MEELRAERKAVIDALHFTGHTPLFIENEPTVRDQEAREIMEKMIDDAEAMIFLYFVTLGADDPILDNRAPIKFELQEFKARHPGGRIFMFHKEVDPHLRLPELMGWVDRELDDERCEVSKHIFRRTEDLAQQVARLTADLPRTETDEEHLERFIVRYDGPDFSGLMERASERLSQLHRLNIDYISFAGRSGVATMNIFCSRDPGPNRSSDASVEGRRAELEESLAEVLAQEVDKAKEDGRMVDGSQATRPQVLVNKDQSRQPRFQIYLEVRTINAPGQLYALTRAMADQGFNIDELLLKPAGQEHARQTWLNFWVSKNAIGSISELEHELLRLESSLRHLVGVRTFSTRVVEN